VHGGCSIGGDPRITAREDLPAMPVMPQTTLLLICSNVFMTFAWYAHLKDMSGRPWFIAALVSWGVALASLVFKRL
jgi:uncharacterized protein (DUF486 family)